MAAAHAAPDRRRRAVPGRADGLTSFFKFTKQGIQKGDAPIGLDNYIGSAGALTFPGVPVGRIVLNTVVWVVVVVIATVLLSLLLAQFLNKPFRGRKLLRLFIILPWAARW